MRVCVIVLSAATLLCAGCQAQPGASRSVYNGGLSSAEKRVPESAAALKPTEAGATFKTNYAPPQPNSTYAGPTNRVRVGVPTKEPEHYYITLKSSQSAQVMRSAGPARATTDQAQLASGTDSAQSQLVAGWSSAGNVTVAEQEISGQTTSSATVSTRSRAHRATSDTDVTREEQVASAVSTTGMARNAQGLGDSEAPQQSASARQPMAASKTVALGAYQKTSGVRGSASPSNVAGNTDTLVGAQRSEADAGANVSAAGNAMAGRTSAAAQANSTTNALSAREDAAAPKGYTGEDAANLLAGRDVVSEFGNAEFLLQPSTTGGAVVYKRFTAARQLAVGEAPAGGSDEGSPTTVRADANAQGLSDSAAGAQAGGARSVMGGRRADALAGNKAARGLRQEAWTSVPAELVGVKPPTLYALKEGRLVDSRTIDKLSATGVIKDRPSGKWLLAYRITLLNATGSAARDIRIMDKIDSSTALLVNSVSTNSDTASAKYSPKSGALEVTLPELKSGGCFILEFFVEP